MKHRGVCSFYSQLYCESPVSDVIHKCTYSPTVGPRRIRTSWGFLNVHQTCRWWMWAPTSDCSKSVTINLIMKDVLLWRNLIGRRWRSNRLVFLEGDGSNAPCDASILWFIEHNAAFGIFHSLYGYFHGKLKKQKPMKPVEYARCSTFEQNLHKWYWMFYFQHFTLQTGVLQKHSAPTYFVFDWFKEEYFLCDICCLVYPQQHRGKTRGGFFNSSTCSPGSAGSAGPFKTSLRP